MQTRTKFQVLIGTISYCVWGFMAYIDPTQRPDFLKFNIALASGIIMLVVRDMPSSPASPTFVSTDKKDDAS